MPLLQIDPFSQPETVPLPRTDVTSIISTISAYYIFLSTLPHISPSWLHFPPDDDGWPGLNENILRSRNRSEKTIALLKHLPYFQRLATQPENPYEDRSVRLSPDTLIIAYHSGHVWDETMHRLCPTTGNVIWLGQPNRFDGTAFLLDVDAGTITEFSTQSHGPPLMLRSEREALAPEGRWMCHPTWSIEAYFWQARRHFMRLVWIPRPSALEDAWEITVRVGNEAVDDEVGEEAEDFEEVEEMEAESTSGEEEDEDDDDAAIPEDEVDALVEDTEPHGTAAPDQATQRTRSRSVQLPPPEGEDPQWLKREQRTWSELVAIYRRNDWPSDQFDKDACIQELLDWQVMAKARTHEETRARRQV